jgi:formylglycine-generating enzyme required for sulfatase activity
LGSGRLTSDSGVPFLLTPVPEPPTLILITAGIFGAAMLRKRYAPFPVFTLTVVLGSISAITSNAITIDTVPVGNPGNAADDNGLGSVGYRFRIGKYEITNAQYVEFLNAVAASDPLELYKPSMTSRSEGGIVRSGSDGSYTYSVKPTIEGGLAFGFDDHVYADWPVDAITWYDAIRFVNWLHNGQGSGDTESGAYTILGGTPTPSNGESITRNPEAKWWLPNLDEWHKAAYYDPAAQIYYDYPMGSDNIPDNFPPPYDTGNSANVGMDPFPGWTWTLPYTEVGSYRLSSSPYGTFDQGGNVKEWNEDVVAQAYRAVRGGSWGFPYGELHADNVNFFLPFGSAGFRVASVIPEPSAILLIVTCALCLIPICVRKRTHGEL